MAIPQALANDPLTRYLTYDADNEAARCLVFTEYAQGLLNSASSADLLFHVSDFRAAALSHRIPDELVSIDAVGLAGSQANLPSQASSICWLDLYMEVTQSCSTMSCNNHTSEFC